MAKLELQAALLGARVANYVQEALTRPVHRRYFWTDSSSVRNWIAAYYKPFVNHRIGEIQTLTEPQEWRFVPGAKNVGDLATRSGLNPGYRIPEEWLAGPEFLKVAEEEWPKDIPWMAILEDIRSSGKCMTTKIVLLTSSFDWESVELDRFDDVLTLENGTEDLVKRAQEEEFNKEIKKIQKKKEVKKNSHLLSLTPILGKDGLLRVGGRIDRAPVPYENRHPIILSAKHPVTRKITRIYHTYWPI